MSRSVVVNLLLVTSAVAFGGLVALFHRAYSISAARSVPDPVPLQEPEKPAPTFAELTQPGLRHPPQQNAPTLIVERLKAAPLSIPLNREPIPDTDFWEEWASNPIAANQKYQGKTLHLKAYLLSIDENGEGGILTGQGRFETGFIFFFFDQAEDVSSLYKGQLVQVVGDYVGRVGNTPSIKFIRCRIK